MPFDVDLGANVDLDMGYGLQAAVGIARGGDTELRGELQYMYRMAVGTDAITFPTFDPILVKTDLTLHSLLLNGQAVFNTNGQVSPYIGVGAGISHGVIEVEVDGDSDDDSDTVPEIQVMGGVLLRVNDRWSLDLGVSYTYAFHKLETDSGSDDAPIDVISLAFGIKVRL
jgi:opacity protein-like surface antigen